MSFPEGNRRSKECPEKTLATRGLTAGTPWKMVQGGISTLWGFHKSCNRLCNSHFGLHIAGQHSISMLDVNA